MSNCGLGSGVTDSTRYGNAHIVGINAECFRRGEAAEVTGACMVKPEGKEWRLCLSLMYADGHCDHVPLTDVGDHYAILIPGDVKLVPR